MRKIFIVFSLLAAYYHSRAQQTEIIYLSGIDKDITVQWDFFCTAGRNSGYWTKIPVPSCWELQGFGTYNYGRDKQFADEKGLYRHKFTLPASVRGNRVFIVFEGSMTDTEVKINGKPAGPVHQGAFYRFKYDITALIKPGSENLLEVTVGKMSANKSVNQAEREADYWIFGGIFRPVYLEIVPDEFIEHVAIDAHADGNFSAIVRLNKNSAPKNINAKIETLDGDPVAGLQEVNAAKGVTEVVIKGRVDNPGLWSPEFPNLYRVVISLKEGDKIRHQVIQRFGFRTVEVRQNDGIYVNGKKVKFKGVCRHSSWPSSGKTTSKEISLLDVNLMKDMNINAVRMSHYPPDQHFLDVCDSLGLFVIDELAGWQAFYDTEVGKKLVKEMVERDVNHPCIILWSNGNEGGFNPELREEYAKYDPQKRLVIEPWHTLNGMNTKHYIPYNYGTATFFNGRDIFFPTEFLHGLFDGGLGAGLEDYWNLMYSNPLSAGGFLWVFADEGVVRTDLNDSIDTKGNLAPDGIVGPYREKEGSFYAIRDIWSPVWIEKKIITPQFDGRLKIENRFHYTSLAQCSFSYYLVKLSDSFYPSEAYRLSRTTVSPSLLPGETGWLNLNLPDNWRDFDVIYLNATDPHGRLINTWSWNISSPAEIAARLIKPEEAKAEGKDEGERVIIASGDVRVSINKSTGLIEEVRKDQEIIPFTNGPRFTGLNPSFRELKHYSSGDKYVVELIYSNRPECHVKYTMMPGGWLKLEWDYKPSGAADLFGITFSFPEDLVTGAILEANGPYHVWKNRLRGTLFGIYDKKYNNTVTGESWDYPEFKGYYSNFYQVKVLTQNLPFTVVSATEDLYLHLFTPEKPKHAAGYVTPPFPEGNISFLHGISAIGTKFLSPEQLGPQGQKNIYLLNRNTEPLAGCVYIKFGE